MPHANEVPAAGQVLGQGGPGPNHCEGDTRPASGWVRCWLTGRALHCRGLTCLIASRLTASLRWATGHPPPDDQAHPPDRPR